MWVIWAIAALGGLIVLAYAYWVWLLAMYPEPVPADEIHWVTTRDLWKLRVYRRRPASGEGEPVLLCHGLGSNSLSLLVPPGESLADDLAAHGYDCWIVDYRGDRSAVPPYGRRPSAVQFEDYLMLDLPAVIEHIRHETGYDRVHWIGHSMGGMLLYAYELAHGTARIASGVTLATPPGFRNSKHPGRPVLGRLVAWTRGLSAFIVRGCAPYARWFRPGQAEGLFNWDNLHPDVGPTHLFHLLDVPPGKLLMQMNDWTLRKEWRLAGEDRDLCDLLPGLRTPLFSVFTARDPFTSPDAARAFYDSLEMTDKRFLMLSEDAGASTDYAHSELVFAPRSAEEVFAPIAEWLAAHPIAQAETADDVPEMVRKASAKRKAASATASAKKKAAANPKAAPADETAVPREAETTEETTDETEQTGDVAE